MKPDDTHYVGSTVRLFARIEDTLTFEIIRSGAKPILKILEPDGTEVTVPAASIEWITSANGKNFKLWSASGLFVPAKTGQHTAWWITSSPYAGKADQAFYVYPAPN